MGRNFIHCLKPSINGLNYIDQFISAEEEQMLLVEIDRVQWLTTLKRRVQHYGYRYNYSSRKADKSDYLGKLPEWSDFLLEKLFKNNFILYKRDQLIVNEYLPGQGIAAHVDCVPCFDDTIIIISIGSGIERQFTATESSLKQSYYLESRSLLILQGEARYNWKHGIVPRKSDVLDGIRQQR